MLASEIQTKKHGTCWNELTLYRRIVHKAFDPLML